MKVRRRDTLPLVPSRFRINNSLLTTLRTDSDLVVIDEILGQVSQKNQMSKLDVASIVFQLIWDVLTIRNPVKLMPSFEMKR